MILAFQETAVPSRPFDPDIVLQVFSQLFARLMAHLPYLILGVVVFVFFLVAARSTYPHTVVLNQASTSSDGASQQNS